MNKKHYVNYVDGARWRLLHNNTTAAAGATEKGAAFFGICALWIHPIDCGVNRTLWIDPLLLTL